MEGAGLGMSRFASARRVLVRVLGLTALCLLSITFGAPVESPALDQLAEGEWQEGRATFYGNGDGYSIDGGHCMYGGIPSPRIIAALSIWDGFGGDWRYTNCGRCFEITCKEGPRHNCRSDRLNSSIIVMVTDKCPCNRWCCGDEPHFDLSYWGFGEIGNHGGGVISLWFRPIECPESMGKGGELVLEPQEWEPYCKTEESKNILDIALDQGLTTFVQSLWSTDLHDDIAGQGKKYTVLAPTNEAYERAARPFNISVEELISKPFMVDVMKSHIIVDMDPSEAQVAAANPETVCLDIHPDQDKNCSDIGEDECTEEFRKNGWCSRTCGFCDEVMTMSGSYMNISSNQRMGRTFAKDDSENSDVEEWTLLNREALILEDNVAACNGEIDVINKVMLPFRSLCEQKENTLYNIASKKGLSDFLGAIDAAGMKDMLSEQGKFTVFAPTNEAFQWLQKSFKGDKIPEDFVSEFLVVGDHVLDHFEEDCNDRTIPLSALESIKDDATLDVWSWNVDQIKCGVGEALGMCSDRWVKEGYCPRTCGSCKPLSELEVGFTLKTLDGDAKGITVYPSSKSQNDPTKPHPYDLVIDGSLRIVDYDKEVCNGMLYVLDKLD